jgi:peptidoglycan/xylan/chitin deacetylase (PgdA/CDA1 family)
MIKRSGVAAILAMALLATSSVEARRPWPQPAAGDSRSGDPEIIFTFDDGPHEDDTAPILDILAAHDIRAIFFWTGWRVRGKKPMHVKRRALALRALAEGHIIGNHTVTHAHLCRVTPEEAAFELDENTRLYTELAGMPPAFLRAPYGDRCFRLETQLAERGYAHLHWDMDASEWQSASSAETRDYFIDKLKKLKGRAVILMHDTKSATRRALPQVLDWISAENARRAVAGARPIRILSYVDLAREQIPPRVQDLVSGVGDGFLSFVPSLSARLLAPLAGPPAPRLHTSNP